MDNNEVTVLVDFGDGQLQQVADDDMDVEELAQLDNKSKDAVEKSLATIRWIAKQTKVALDNMDKVHQRPSEMELEFGIKVTTKAGVLVLNAEGEFHIKAKLVWKKDNAQQ